MLKARSDRRQPDKACCTSNLSLPLRCDMQIALLKAARGEEVLSKGDSR
jgi:hypothetical protein